MEVWRFILKESINTSIEIHRVVNDCDLHWVEKAKQVFSIGIGIHQAEILSRDFQESSNLFETMISQIDQDEAARLYSERSQKYLIYSAPPIGKLQAPLKIKRFYLW